MIVSFVAVLMVTDGLVCLSVCLPLGHRQANEDIKNSFVNILAAASIPLTCVAAAA